MSMMAPQIFLSYTLGNWIQHLHNIESWSHYVTNDEVNTQTNDIFSIFERMKLMASRKKERTFIFNNK